MAEPKENPLMEKIVSLCKRRGFVFQSSEIYGGINGFWDYGPLGAELKRNVKELWWHAMTRQRDDVAGLEATIIMSPQIWKASGHVDTFADLMVECPVTNKRFRADQIEPQSGTVFHFKGAISTSTIAVLLKLKKEDPKLLVGAAALDEYIQEDSPSSLVDYSRSKIAFYVENVLKTITDKQTSEAFTKAAQRIVENIIASLDTEIFVVLDPKWKTSRKCTKDCDAILSEPRVEKSRSWLVQ